MAVTVFSAKSNAIQKKMSNFAAEIKNNKLLRHIQ